VTQTRQRNNESREELAVFEVGTDRSVATETVRIVGRNGGIGSTFTILTAEWGKNGIAREIGNFGDGFEKD
jgi:hypothetical protein